jgi:hypothetical protein
LHRQKIYIPVFLLSFLFSALVASAQEYKVRGYVYDSSRNYPLEAVSVLNTAGNGTATNSDGFYEIAVSEKDSIWFSYLGKPTKKFPILSIPNILEFERLNPRTIALILFKTDLPTLRCLIIKNLN